MKKKHIQLFKGKGKQPWRYRIVSANGQVTNPSEGYSRKWNAKKAALRDHGPLPIVDLTKK